MILVINITGHKELQPLNLDYEVGHWAFLYRSVKIMKATNDYCSKALQHLHRVLVIDFVPFLNSYGLKLLQKYSAHIYFLSALLITTGKVYLSSYLLCIISFFKFLLCLLLE